MLLILIRVALPDIKCNLTELRARSTSFTHMVSGLLDMPQVSLCSWFIGHLSSFVGVLVSVFLSVSIFPECWDTFEAVSRLFF